MASIYTAFYDSPFGILKLEANDEFLLSSYFVLEKDSKESKNYILKQAIKELSMFFNRELDIFSLPLIYKEGFSGKALKELAKIPFASTISYKELAKRAGNEKASRAVARIASKNPYTLILPCHRVISSNKGLGGYSAPNGVELKKLLLEWERDA